MRKKTIYLSGNMTPNSGAYYSWVSRMTEDLDLDYDLSWSVEKHDPKFIVRHDLARLKKCDILVVNLGVTNTKHHLTGAIVEVYEAYKQNIPVYAFVGDDLKRSEQASSPWISEFITHEFDSYSDIVFHLRWEENLPK